MNKKTKAAKTTKNKKGKKKKKYKCNSWHKNKNFNTKIYLAYLANLFSSFFFFLDISKLRKKV